MAQPRAGPRGDQWMYLDAVSGQQRGPLPEAIVKRLIRKGMLAPQQFVWTPRLKEWTAVSATDPFVDYCRVWFSQWYYMTVASSVERLGPVSTKDLVALFLDGDIDGLSLVWTSEMNEWKPIGEVPSLKEFLHEANEDQDRAAETMEAHEQVAPEDQIFEEESSAAFVAEDGKQYVFDAETKKWITPEQKIEDELDALRDEGDPDGAAMRKKKRAAPRAPPIPENAASAESIPMGIRSTVDAVNNDSKEVSTDNDSNTNASTASETTDSSTRTANTTGDAPAADDNKKRKKKKKKKSEKWQKKKTNTWVYVNGLPLDVTVEEVHDHFAKCGVVQTDLLAGTPRIKLYENKDYGGLNGDASVCYMKEASVELAVQLLDKSFIRPEYVHLAMTLSCWAIDVSPAVFQQKGDEFVKRKKLRLDTRARVKQIEQQKALSWNEGEDGDRAGLRIVVIKHMFTPDEIEDDTYEQELTEDIEGECTKIGTVEKITLFAKHADGVVVIKFGSSGSAAQCVDIMNGRFFAGRKLACQFWDGTDYTHRESKADEEVRTEEFGEWLEGGSSSDEEEETNPESHDEKHRDDEETNDTAGYDNDDSEEEDASGPHHEVHAGRVLPDLDDDDNSD